MRLILFSILIICFSVNAQEFSNFELVEDKSQNLDRDDIRNFSPIYEQILNRYSTEYQSIVDRLSGDQQNGSFGGPNMIGWRHAGDFSAFKIIFNRTAAPTIEGDGAIVNDSILIEIDAAKFIDELADENVIKITEVNKKAFAGLKFRRELRFNHFSESVTEGLQTNADRLFFMFKYFNAYNFKSLEEYDYLLKEDSLVFNAGGLYTAPIGNTGISVATGALASYEKSSKITIQKLGFDDGKSSDESLRVNVENSSMTKVGANVSVVIDFFKLLNLTLFQYDYVYENEKTNIVYFNFNDQDLLEETKIDELQKALKLREFDLDVLSENIVSKETRVKETRESKYLAFIFGGIKKADTEKREIVKNGILTTIFSHTYRKLKYTENFFSKIMNLFLGSILGQGFLAQRTDVVENKVNLDYESERNIIKNKEDFNIFDKNVFTMSMSYHKSYYQNTKINKKKIKSSLKSAIEGYTESYDVFAKAFSDYDVQAPADFYVKRVFDNKNMENFISITEDEMKSIIKDACKTKSHTIFKKFRSLFSGCKRKLVRSYSSFLKEWETANYDYGLYKKCKRRTYRKARSLSLKRAYLQKCMELSRIKTRTKKSKELPLWRFKNFIGHFHNYINDKYIFQDVFGNFYNWGWFEGNLNGSIPYKNYFKEGIALHNISTQFDVDNNLNRTPSSLEEQDL